MPGNKDLNRSIQYLKGIGPKRAAVLAARGIKSVRDLLYYFPYDYLDLSKIEKISNLHNFIRSGQWITTIGRVYSFDLLGRPPRQRFVVIVRDGHSTVELVFFQSIHYFKKYFKTGETIAASGKVTEYRTHLQIVHPSIDKLSVNEDEEELAGFLHTKGIVPKYRSSEDLRDVNLHVKGFRRVMKNLINENINSIEEVLPDSIRIKNFLIKLPEALTSIHFPQTQADIETARHRLKFDELFSMQLLLAVRRRSVKSESPGISYNIESKLARQLVDSLPFNLTNAQVKVINEIATDMKSNRPMNRLLQGDVGSGKTIVALIALLIAIDNGYQAAFMAPTEILAEQHFQTLSSFLSGIPVKIRLLTGGQSNKLRNEILEEMRSGFAQITVGTHALIQEDVEFASLGLVIIDEQHRFGVAQRSTIKEKGIKSNSGNVYPDVLVMTATPIPRTLSLTIYGDLDISIIDEMPKNRQSIKTYLKTESQRKDVYEFIREEVNRGRQIYIVYPLIEESEKIDLKAATESYELLKREIFPDLKIGIVHGRMASDEKDEVMLSFKERTTDILVATTVIEVGIDIPNATVMVIEHAERFGLSQLHQLRGRVGRGAQQSTCILITPDWLGRLVKKPQMPSFPDQEGEEKLKAARRVKTIIEYNNGFKIAEIDLELRGPGDFFGTRQSGLPELQIANLMTDQDILASARREAFQLVDQDPHLRSSENQPLRKYFIERMRGALSLAEIG